MKTLAITTLLLANVFISTTMLTLATSWKIYFSPFFHKQEVTNHYKCNKYVLVIKVRDGGFWYIPMFHTFRYTLSCRQNFTCNVVSKYYILFLMNMTTIEKPISKIGESHRNTGNKSWRLKKLLNFSNWSRDTYTLSTFIT